MVLRGAVRLKPSLWAHRMLIFGLPGSLLLLAYAAWAAGSVRPLFVVPVVLLVSLVAASSWDRVRGLEFRARSLLLDLGDGCWHPVVPIGPARISSLAVTLACRRASDGHRLRLNIWRDAVDATTYRRLARIARHGRWPEPVDDNVKAARTASGDCR